jgi:hypothetical protein
MASPIKDLTDKRKYIIDYYKSHPKRSGAKIAKELGISDGYLSQLLSTFKVRKHIVWGTGRQSCALYCKRGHYQTKETHSQGDRCCKLCKRIVSVKYVPSYRKKILGFSKTSYRAMVEKQSSCCAICLKQTDKLVVDHNHKTAQLRELLCNTCNMGIGLFKDDVSVLANAIKYLNQHETLTAEV